MSEASAYEPVEVLKRDLFGEVTRGTWRASDRTVDAVRRDVSRAPFWTRWIARSLARREGRALARLAGVPGVPELLARPRGGLVLRRWIDGVPLHRAQAPDAEWFARARRLLVRIHRHGVAHNDLAKEPNLLVTMAGEPALLDFQLATVHARRSRLFRMLAREDLRHLLKHKRHYQRESLTLRERALLARPSCPARWWRRLGKPLYLFVTRVLLRWRDREGAGDRGTRGRSLREGGRADSAPERPRSR